MVYRLVYIFVCLFGHKPGNILLINFLYLFFADMQKSPNLFCCNGGNLVNFLE